MKHITLLSLVVTVLLLILGGCNAPSAPNDTSCWLGEADPNPVHIGESTVIPYCVTGTELGNIIIMNCTGAPVRKIVITEGSHSIYWDGCDEDGRQCATGVYYYSLHTPSMSQTKKMLLVR